MMERFIRLVPRYTNQPVAKQMNYALAVFVFVVLFSVGFWYTHGRHFYTGPVLQTRTRRSQAVLVPRTAEGV